MWLGCAAILVCTATSEAQTYYYYPSSGTNAPGVTAAPTTTPTYYYRRGLFGRTRSVDVFSSVLPDGGGASNLPARRCSSVSSGHSLPSRRTRRLFLFPITTATAAATPAAAAAPAATEPTAPTASVENGDPYGFLGWLNATRASYGLPAVGHDPNLSGWAAENNNHQAARGMGHFVMGPARRQNAAMGSFGEHRVDVDEFASPPRGAA